MANNLPKHTARKILIKYRHYSFNNYIDLKHIIESNQFTIIEYKKYANSEPLSELIKRLGIKNEIEQNDSFLYINNNLRFLFINEDIPDDDKCSLLIHELGHICDPDLKSKDTLKSRIQKEEFANEFSHYIKNPQICFKFFISLIKRWKLTTGIITLLICVLGVLFLLNSQADKNTTETASGSVVYNDICYYVTSAGKKYHKRNCIIIKYRNNLTEYTLTEALENGYEPCMICNPEE